MRALTPQQTVVITGGGRRIGLALAQHLLARDMAVIISYRHRYPEVDALAASGAHCICADFSTDAGIDAFAQAVKARCGHLRALIHNASDWQPERPDVPPSHTLAAMLQIHVHAPYLLNLALRPLLEGQGLPGADIIHLTDYVAECGSARHIAYAASKAALENLTRSFAALLAPAVKVNAIAPAMIMFNEDDDDDYRARALTKSALKRIAGVGEVVAAVDYLLASRYITGRTLALDGGRHLL